MNDRRQGGENKKGRGLEEKGKLSTGEWNGRGGEDSDMGGKEGRREGGMAVEESMFIRKL